MQQRGVRLMRASLVALAVVALAAAPTWAEPMTREQGETLIQEIRQLRQALERVLPPPPARQALPAQAEPVEASLAGVVALGKPDAPLVMVAYVDYECPFCQRFDLDTFPALKRDYIDTGKLRFVVKDLPLDFHPRARKAAEATHCAGEQSAFWALRDVLVRNQKQLDDASLVSHAKVVGLKVDAFQRCLESGRHAKRVTADLEEARKLRITGTPTFVLGKAQGETVRGEKLVGAAPLATFEQKLRELSGG